MAKCDGDELPVILMLIAACEGQLAMCKYLRDKGCVLSAEACDMAANGGHLNVLMWLLEHDGPWNELTVAWSSVHSGSVETIAYVLQHTVPQPNNVISSEMLRTAGAHGHLAAAKWLRHEQHASWPTTLSANVSGTVTQWSGEVLAWARANGCTTPVTLQ
jgi:hypothetical protein